MQPEITGAGGDLIVEEMDGVERSGALCCVAVGWWRCCSGWRMVDLAGVSGRDAGRRPEWGAYSSSHLSCVAWKTSRYFSTKRLAMNSLITQLEDHNVPRRNV